MEKKYEKRRKFLKKIVVIMIFYNLVFWLGIAGNIEIGRAIPNWYIIKTIITTLINCYLLIICKIANINL